MCEEETLFLESVNAMFPNDGKWSTSAVIHKEFGEKIKKCLEDPSSYDKNLRFMVKKHGFKLFNLPSMGLKEILVVPVNDHKDFVSFKFTYNLLLLLLGIYDCFLYCWWNCHLNN